MTLPDGNEKEERAGEGPDGAPDVERAVAMHQEQVDMAEAPAAAAPSARARKAREAVTPAGTALAEAAVAVDPFPDRAAREPEPTATRSFKTVMLDYSAHAAMIVGLIGFAWTVSDHVVARPTATQIEAPGPTAGPQRAAQAAPAKPEGKVEAKAEAKADELAALRVANDRMAKDVDALRAELGTLHAALQREGTPDQLRALAGDLEGVKAGLSTVKGETTAAIAALSSKVDKAQRETDGKVQRLATAQGAIEQRQAIDTTATGSLASHEARTADANATAASPVKPVPTRPSAPTQAHALPVPVPVAKPATRLASAEDARRDEGRRPLAERTDDEATAKPAVLPGWVVREVYQGVALIEGRRGELEVVPGVSIPGAGIVKSIERHGNGWTVTTTKGLLAYAAPQREYRRATRDYYPDPRDDF